MKIYNYCKKKHFNAKEIIHSDLQGRAGPSQSTPIKQHLFSGSPVLCLVLLPPEGAW